MSQNNIFTTSANVLARMAAPEVEGTPDKLRARIEHATSDISHDQLEGAACAMAIAGDVLDKLGVHVADSDLAVGYAIALTINALSGHALFEAYRSYGDPEGYRAFMDEVERL